MLEKVRPPITHPANGSDPQPEAGLSEGRLALVHRYMIDAEEAETRKLAAARKAEVRARAEAQEREAQAAAAAEEQARREAAEQELMRLEVERLRAERARARAVRSAPAIGTVGGEMHSAASVKGRGLAPRVIGGVDRLVPPKGEGRAVKDVGQDDKRAAKQAAQRIAALEKKEARERRALAKAAMRRQRG
jgi:hypothetical protein